MLSLLFDDDKYDYDEYDDHVYVDHENNDNNDDDMIGVIVNKSVNYVNNRRKKVEDERFNEVLEFM